MSTIEVAADMGQKERSPASLARDQKKQQQAVEADQIWAEAAADKAGPAHGEPPCLSAG